MSKVLLRKFGVKRITPDNRELLCKECGERAGFHYGSDCPVLRGIELRKTKIDVSKLTSLSEPGEPV